MGTKIIIKKPKSKGLKGLKSSKKRVDPGADAIPTFIVYFGNRITPITLHKNKAYIIGRSSQSDITLKDPTVSRVHAKLSYSKANNQWTYRDLNSTNGTLIGEMKVPLDEHEFCFLEDDALLEIGDTIVRFKHISKASTPNLKKKTSNIAFIGFSDEELENMIAQTLDSILGLEKLEQSYRSELDRRKNI